MRPFTWGGIAIMGGGTVLMLLSEQLPGISAEQTTGLWSDHVGHFHWYLLVGILLTLTGGLLAQFGQALFRRLRMHHSAKPRFAGPAKSVDI
jgi:hypothetical protein